jgi:chaperone required for assembly of F1-ATPase
MTDEAGTSSSAATGGAPAPMKIRGTSAAPAKRFYAAVTVGVVCDGPAGASPSSGPLAGYRILLDGRAVRTPAKRAIVLSSKLLAEAVAAEWEAQRDRIFPASMPMTRLVNTALDGVTGREREVSDDIVKYASSDLICYRAEAPAALAERQAGAWDPLLDWAAGELGIALACSSGIAHVRQPDSALRALSDKLADLGRSGDGPLRLAALHVMTALSGSALLAWAVARGRVSPEQAWAMAHVDEDWQISQWGEDAEAVARRRQRAADFHAACLTIRTLM